MTEDQFTYELKIPHDRIAVLIGKDGEVKAELEQVTNTKLTIDSKEGDVFITGEDGLGIYACREVIRAISRGFNPDVAKLLLKNDYSFETISLSDQAGKSKNVMLRVKGRVIGKEGKARKTIEDLTETHICIYGKTIAIIGEMSSVPVARAAITALIKGSTHAKVYKALEKKRSELRRNAFMPPPPDVLK